LKQRLGITICPLYLAEKGQSKNIPSPLAEKGQSIFPLPQRKRVIAIIFPLPLAGEGQGEGGTIRPGFLIIDALLTGRFNCKGSFKQQARPPMLMLMKYPDK